MQTDRGYRSPDQEGYSGVVLKTWGVKVVVAVCSDGSSSPGGCSGVSECVSRVWCGGSLRAVGRGAGRRWSARVAPGRVGGVGRDRIGGLAVRGGSLAPAPFRSAGRLA